MKYTNYNTNGKFWGFSQEHIQVMIITDSEQHLNLQNTLYGGNKIITTIVHAKCNISERLSVQKDIYGLSHNFSLPWLVGS